MTDHPIPRRNAGNPAATLLADHNSGEMAGKRSCTQPPRRFGDHLQKPLGDAMIVDQTPRKNAGNPAATSPEKQRA